MGLWRKHAFSYVTSEAAVQVTQPPQPRVFGGATFFQHLITLQGQAIPIPSPADSRQQPPKVEVKKSSRGVQPQPPRYCSHERDSKKRLPEPHQPPEPRGTSNKMIAAILSHYILERFVMQQKVTKTPSDVSLSRERLS